MKKSATTAEVLYKLASMHIRAQYWHPGALSHDRFVSIAGDAGARAWYAAQITLPCEQYEFSGWVNYTREDEWHYAKRLRSCTQE